MKVSLNWIRFIDQKYGCAPEPAANGVDELVETIGVQLGAVEEVIDLSKKYDGLLIAKVAECIKHPNADKLSFCLVDDGGVNKEVKRNSDGLIEVVCGAPNVKAGQLAVWVPPGATVPASYDKEPFVIAAREIRGKVSNGMLASPKELALGDSNEGILILDEGKPGDDFAKTAGLDDYVIDIENKMFTHRPDLFGQLGIAREIAGIQHQPFKSPAWYREDASLPSDGRKNSLKLSVKNELPKLVPRFCAVAIKDIIVSPSPLWLQVRLTAAGVRPINNIVDITNFYMLETAQPLHAYDYDKVKTGTLGVRWANKGEQLKLLGGKDIKIDHDAIVITDGSKPIGLGGVMGGADTEVDENTKNIILECANFDMNTTRRSAMAYGLFTDAATRFTKNQSPHQNMAVLCKAVEDINRLAGGRAASPVIDDSHYPANSRSVELSTEFINSRLGLRLSATEIKKILENVEFDVEGTDELKITTPFWRTDIHIPEDVVEEIGRLHGYGKLPVILPKRDISPASKDSLIDFKSRIRQILNQAGANEALTYSFVHKTLLEKVGQDSKKAYHIKNALSPSLQYYRLSLTPSLLEKVHPNIKEGFGEFILFEIGKAHIKGRLDDNKIPVELERLSLVFASKQKPTGAPYYRVKKYLEYLLSELGIEGAQFKPLGQKAGSMSSVYYEPKRAADLIVNGKLIGRVGEFKKSIRSNLKLPKNCAGLEIKTDALMELASPPRYNPINRFPSLDQDFCLRSSSELSYQQLTDFINGKLKQLSEKHCYEFGIEPLDIFQKKDDKKTKQTTWRIILWHPDRTLTTKETNELLDKLAEFAKKELNAERI